jgi:hypothetical protein
MAISRRLNIPLSVLLGLAVACGLGGVGGMMGVGTAADPSAPGVAPATAPTVHAVVDGVVALPAHQRSTRQAPGASSESCGRRWRRVCSGE